MKIAIISQLRIIQIGFVLSIESIGITDIDCYKTWGDFSHEKGKYDLLIYDISFDRELQTKLHSQLDILLKTTKVILIDNFLSNNDKQIMLHENLYLFDSSVAIEEVLDLIK